MYTFLPCPQKQTHKKQPQKKTPKKQTGNKQTKKINLLKLLLSGSTDPASRLFKSWVLFLIDKKVVG